MNTCIGVVVFFFKQKTAYEMRISDWSSDVCSSDLQAGGGDAGGRDRGAPGRAVRERRGRTARAYGGALRGPGRALEARGRRAGRALRVSGEIGRASCRDRVCQYV